MYIQVTTRVDSLNPYPKVDGPGYGLSAEGLWVMRSKFCEDSVNSKIMGYGRLGYERYYGRASAVA